MSNSIDCLAYADTVGVIGVGIAVKGFELSAFFPSQGMAEVGGGIVALAPLYVSSLSLT